MAVEYLHDKRYIIRECDWKFGKRDIDIIALTPDETEVVFVEVKTRTTDEVAKPEDAVDMRKIRSIGVAANAYVKMCDVVEELRFDVGYYTQVVSLSQGDAHVLQGQPAGSGQHGGLEECHGQRR